MMGGRLSSGPTIRVLHRTPRCVIAGSPVNALSMNQYLIGCRRTRQAFLLDCGDGDNGLAPWEEFAKEKLWSTPAPQETSFDRDTTAATSGAADGRITGVLQTHCHCDHIGGIQPIVSALPSSCKVYLHRGDDVWLKDPFAGMTYLARAFPALKPPVDLEALSSSNRSNDGDAAAAPRVRHVADGDVVTVGELTFRTLHVPGHTPGQCVFHCATEDVAFVGDLIFDGSVGRTDLPYSEPAAMQRSLKRVCAELPDAVTLFSGHGGPTRMGTQRQHNPFLRGLGPYRDADTAMAKL